ncbi:MAG: hypothetical protein U0N82_11900, partial [Oscillospiraceae bacterium]
VDVLLIQKIAFFHGGSPLHHNYLVIISAFSGKINPAYRYKKMSFRASALKWRGNLPLKKEIATPAYALVRNDTKLSFYSLLLMIPQ